MVGGGGKFSLGLSLYVRVRAQLPSTARVEPILTKKYNTYKLVQLSKAGFIIEGARGL